MQFVSKVLFVLLFFHSFVLSQKLNLAINDLDPQGVEPTTSVILSDRIRAELINSNRFRVMERSEMQSILKEQGFQQSGACTDNACIVEIGQLLGVKAILAGTIGKIENLYTISVRMINIQTGEIEFVINENCECPVKTLLNEMMPSIARKIMERIDLQKKKEKLGATGFLTVNVKPSAALLLVNGEPAKAGVALELPIGSIKIAASLKDYDPYDALVTLATDEKISRDIVLKHSTAFETDRVAAKKRHLWVARAVAGALALGAGAGGFVMNRQANKAYDDYSAITTPGDHSAEFKKATDKEKLRNILYGTAGGFAVLGLVTFAF